MANRMGYVMRSLGEVVRKYRILRGLSQAELAEKIGVEQTTLSKYERGKLQIDGNTLLKLIDILKIDISELLGNAEPTKLAVTPFKLVPIFDTEVSAGNGIFPEAFQPVDFLPTELATADYAFKVHGDSMEPILINGDIVIVKATPEAETGDLIVCIYNNQFYVKWFVRMNGKITLQSENSEYPPITVEPDDRFEIIGKVIRVIRTPTRKRFKRG